MTAYILRRLLALPVVLLAVSFVVFVLVRSVPGDPVNTILGEKSNKETRARITRELGLDRPILIQYGIYLERLVLHGDLGTSYIRTGRPIVEEIGRRFQATLELTGAAMLVALFGGIALGILSAVYKSTWIDTLGMTLAMTGVSIPVFWLGLILLILFGHWLAGGGNLSPEYSVDPLTGFILIDTVLHGREDLFLDALRHLVLPALALGTIPMAMIARMTRSSMLETLASDYVRTARAKGLATETIVMKHAFRNGLIPVVTLIGLEFGYLLGGAVLTETVFDWPGMGTYILRAVTDRDFMAIQGGILVMGVTFVLVNLVVDILYAFIDPRVHYG